MKLLHEILQTKRADKSVGDYLFRAWLLQRLSYLKPTIVGDGNIVVTTDPKSRVLYSCHADTCHSVQESDGSPQKIKEDLGLIMLDGPSHCLGADDAVGIYIMLELIAANKPGTYIFHTGEETGAAGSRSANANRSFTSRFDMTVAFDRAVHPGERPEVITVQGGLRCASDDCGKALAEALNAAVPELGYYVSERGVFTDTRNYAPNVAENFNIGCFYWDQHSPAETVDVLGVARLLEAALAVDWASLPIVRALPKPMRLVDHEYSGYTGSSLSKLAVQSVYDEGYDFDAYNQMSEEAAEEYDTLSHALEQAADYQKFALLADLLSVHSFPDEPEQHEAATAYYERHLARIPVEVLREYLGDLEIMGDCASTLDMINSDIINTQ